MRPCRANVCTRDALHWGRVTHIFVSNLTIIASDNGWSPGRRQAIFWTNAGILLIGPLDTNKILIEIHTFSFRKMPLKMSSGKWRSFYLDFHVLKRICMLTSELPLLLCSYCHEVQIDKERLLFCRITFHVSCHLYRLVVLAILLLPRFFVDTVAITFSLHVYIWYVRYMIVTLAFKKTYVMCKIHKKRKCWSLISKTS